MPYYSAGDYYRGDGNYAAGGIFGTIGKALGKVGKAIIGATPVGRVIQAAVPSFNPPSMPTITGFAPPVLVPKPGFKGAAERFFPGGESGYMVAKRRHMNVTNVKALRRAGRRVKGFLKLASRLGALPVARGKSKRLFKRKSR
jgi:hypothetical protein